MAYYTFYEVHVDQLKGSTVWIKHAMKIVTAMMKTITTAIRMIEIVVAAVVVSAMWQSMIL